MKFTWLLTLIIYTTSAYAAPGPGIVTAYVKSHERVPTLLSGLAESIFDYAVDTKLKPADKIICYTQKSEDVCAEILATSQRSQQKYLDGAHEVMHLNSCASVKNFIRVEYTLSSDFGTKLDIARVLFPCTVRD